MTGDREPTLAARVEPNQPQARRSAAVLITLYIHLFPALHRTIFSFLFGSPEKQTRISTTMLVSLIACPSSLADANSVENPLNREPPIKELVREFITEASTAYDRNHSAFPHIDGETFRLRVDGGVRNVLELSIDTLRNDFSQHEVISALQCAGNRRHTMRTKVKEVDGIDWNDGAVCNCTWRGPLLADILAKANISMEGNVHVAFNCFQADCQDDTFYGSSIPLERCMDKSKQVILALEMNGRPLTINHGFPLRAVMPGIAGARWTKWLDHITVQCTESLNYYMQKDYKILPPCVETKQQALEYWPRVPAIQGLPINSIIAYPESNTTISPKELTAEGELEVCGYALPQADDGPVVKVEVSADGGKSWAEAEIVFPPNREWDTPEGKTKYKWAWAIWKYKLPQAKKITQETTIWSRATDAGGNTQDGTIPWNYRGVAYNAYGEATGLQIWDNRQKELVNGVGGLKL
ncbi:Oxidoreductase, molybdopterin-binding domain-containing protein [Sphaerosporella brunnea]|uniref:Oxidoreductase, molybdopterin-binding domain-containing protein n=1 Tax=Sphaerosporella brunnea TaxID=1250544 RepID=A0A5J5F4R9_9PEZI|nr:Oxidoreductase, molybdopterin-binding domain-containing protein [Sphaerosporella brunnea]